MRSRSAIPFFIAGLLGTLLAVYLFSETLSFFSLRRTPEPSVRPPSYPYPSATPDSSALIEQELNKLPVGEVYHNVPDGMQAGVKETIEAEIAPKITQKIKDELKGRGEINVTPGIWFDPAGVDMNMIVEPDEFKVLKVRGGRQFVTSKAPGKWV